MYSREYEEEACRSGYQAYQERGPKADARHYGYGGSPRATWCWYTGFVAAESRSSLKQAYRTLRMKHG